MRLSWNEIRACASLFAREWKDATYEKGETQSFYNDFFNVFGVRRRSVARYEEHVRKLNDHSGFIDLFWPGVLLVEQKSAGRDLKKAYEQAGEYFDALTERERPRYILVSDFQSFELRDLDDDKTTRFLLEDFPAHVELFGFILGIQRRAFRDQDPVNIEAAELVGKLYDAIANSGHLGQDLESFLVRLVFCMFADDTGIFEPRDIFLNFIEERTSDDGADLGPWLAHLFETLNTPENKRAKSLDEDLARFPHVNGDLFDGNLQTFSFNTAMRNVLLDACRFDWSNISPAIFGVLFQSVMDPVERREKGAHYTTEKNILKVIEPLFMDDLRAEFNRLKTRQGRGRIAALHQFQKKLGGLKFFDPACGCGNFLVIAYRELRLLEIEAIREIMSASTKTGQVVLDVSIVSEIDVDQYYGIELGKLPARIAETALWMMDHIMNNRLSIEFGQTYTRIPLKKSPKIIRGDALETDWTKLLPPGECSYVLGNPPFGGAKFQTAEQRMQIREIAALGNSGGTLDYVAAWFIKAGEYVKSSNTRIGFVATNSITQGEQVAQLWPILFNRYNLEIAFAHRTFAWGSDARGKAQVHVVILGLEQKYASRAKKSLFTYLDVNSEPEESRHAALSPYLFDASKLRNPHLTVWEESRPINELRRLKIGSQPIDGGHYIFDSEEREAFLEIEPEAEQWLKPFIGAKEYLHGNERWILVLHDTPLETLKRLPKVQERIANVRTYREKSKRVQTQKLAKTPRLYQVNVIPTAPFLVIPEVSSERREYAPIGWLEPPVIPSNKLHILTEATLINFAILTSTMHMSWLRHIGRRLKSDYSYSIGLVYNTFPMPSKKVALSKLEPLAQAVLDARNVHKDATLADLYDPDLMPPNLRRAHQAIDWAVDRLYKRGGFNSERERVEHLFMLYEEMGEPLTAAKKSRRRRKR